MAKIVYACSRRASFGPSEERKLEKICKRLEPDNLASPVPHKVLVERHVAYGIVNGRGAATQGSSVLLGCLYGDDESWYQPGAAFPEGSYAIVRNGADSLEVVSDAAASRTVWYSFDEERFVASTSQRAIVMFLGSFDFDERVVPWMLSTGALGPDLSGDRRFKRLPPDASVLLDKARWSISVRQRPIVFAAKARSAAEHKQLLVDEVRRVIGSLTQRARLDEYLLPLSGGYDSRALLCFLTEAGARGQLKAITWGLEQSAQREGNDAAVAKALAAKVGVRHKYFHTDVAAEAIDQVIDRFLFCGEGRNDHVAGYMDGMEIWRKLVEEENCSGIIRGDHGFGWIPVPSEASLLRYIGLALCADYRNLSGFVEKSQLPRQEFPAGLRRKKGETLSAWRDRLFHAYRVPTILAALSDIKASYVEIINPFQARSILERVRELPDELRTNKALWREIVRSITPDVPFASEGAIAERANLFKEKRVVDMVRKKLASEGAKRIFHAAFLDYALRCIAGQSGARKAKRKSWRDALKSLLPRPISTWLRDRVVKPSLDGHVLAFLAFVVVRMHELLSADCGHAAEEETLSRPSRAARVASVG
jgi:asparagine synthetase B (glutamine-hydrolysing)